MTFHASRGQEPTGGRGLARSVLNLGDLREDFAAEEPETEVAAGIYLLVPPFLEGWKWARVDRRTTEARALRCSGSCEQESFHREGGREIAPVGGVAGLSQRSRPGRDVGQP